MLFLQWTVKNIIVIVVSDFLLNKINFVGGDKLLQVFKHGFLRSEQNVSQQLFYTQNVCGKMFFSIIFQYLCMVGIITIHVGRCFAFSNHQRFSLRCLSLDLIPVSIRLRSTIKIPKGKQIIKKVERALLNEIIRSINNTLSMLKQRRDTCIFQLEEKLDRESMEECRQFIKIKREA